jgi:hypothetical protein
MIFISNMYDSYFRIEVKYDFLLKNILPSELIHLKYYVIPKISRGIFGLAVFGFSLRFFFPFSIITVVFSQTFCYILSFFFVVMLIFEVIICYYIHDNIFLFFPTKTPLGKSNPGILGESAGMALKIVGSSGFKGIAGGLGFVYLLDGVHAKMFPETEGLLHRFGRQLSHPPREWKKPK